MYQQHMLLKFRKHILKYIYLSIIMCIVFASFKHLKLPISIKIPVTLWQNVHICITAVSHKNEFMKYLLANLLVAWL